MGCEQFLRKLEPEVKEELEDTFRHLLVSTEVGYVLYGNKPVCMLGIDSCRIPYFYCQNIKTSSHLKNFCKLLEDLNLRAQGNFLIRRGVTGSGFGDKHQEVLFINRKNFLKVVRENITLFQYILGPEVTPEKLLAKLLDPNETLFSVLNTNFALVGIVLGYGTQNGLFYHRKDLLEPLSSFYQEDSRPSFGYKSSQEEFECLQKKARHSRNLDPGSYPPPVVFGYIEHDETTAILADFRRARKKIRGALQRNLLSEVLSIFFDEFPDPVKSKKLRFTGSEELQLRILARKFAYLCTQNPALHDEVWKEAFLEGLQSTSSTILSPQESATLSLDLDLKKRAGYDFGTQVRRSLQSIIAPDRVAAAFRKETDCSELSLEESELLYQMHLEIFSKQRKEEQEVALQHFKKLPPSSRCILKDRLYLELLNKGKGAKTKAEDVVEVREYISNHEGVVLSQATATYDLKTAIEGYQAGLTGQTVGSKLRLYIHPKVGYRGFSSPLGDTFLIAELEILSIKK